MERDDSHRKTIVLLKRNVNFLLTGTVYVRGGGTGAPLYLCITRNSWTRNLIFRGLPYTNLRPHNEASTGNYTHGFLHIAR